MSWRCPRCVVNSRVVTGPVSKPGCRSQAWPLPLTRGCLACRHQEWENMFPIRNPGNQDPPCHLWLYQKLLKFTGEGGIIHPPDLKHQRWLATTPKDFKTLSNLYEAHVKSCKLLHMLVKNKDSVLYDLVQGYITHLNLLLLDTNGNLTVVAVQISMIFHNITMLLRLRQCCHQFQVLPFTLFSTTYPSPPLHSHTPGTSPTLPGNNALVGVFI